MAPKFFEVVSQCVETLLVVLDDEPTAEDWTAASAALVTMLCHPDCPRDWRDGLVCRIVERCTGVVDRELEEWPISIDLNAKGLGARAPKPL